MMELILDQDHPLAQAIIDAPVLSEDVFLVLKSPGIANGSYFRALVRGWEIHRDGAATLRFESWEEHVERKARSAGL